MLINGFDIANLNAKQFAVEFSHAAIKRRFVLTVRS